MPLPFKWEELTGSEFAAALKQAKSDPAGPLGG
jgi:hypothetical protein